MEVIINIKNSVLEETQNIDFLGLIIDPAKMTLVLIDEKLTKITGQCQDLLSQPQSVLALTKLIGLVFKYNTYNRKRMQHYNKKVHSKQQKPCIQYLKKNCFGGV